jgi:hypothetical protein
MTAFLVLFYLSKNNQIKSIEQGKRQKEQQSICAIASQKEMNDVF